MEEWKRSIIKDPRLGKILDSKFNRGEFLLNLLRECNVGEFSEVYGKINSIRQSLIISSSSFFAQNAEALTKDLEKMNKTSLDLESCKTRSKKIKETMDKIKVSYIHHYDVVAKKLPTLQNTYEAKSLCGLSLRFIQNLKILKPLVGHNYEILDMLKSSQIIDELMKVARERDLSGLSFYDKEKEYIVNVQEALKQKAEKKFQAGLSMKNESEIKTTLQIFLNLNILTKTIQQTANELLKEAMNAWKNCLTKEYEPSTVVQSMIKEIKDTLTLCLSQTNQMWMLSLALKARDTNNLESYEEILSEKNLSNIFELFWSKQIHIIQQSFQKLKENSARYEQNWRACLKNYPKIYSLFDEFLGNFNETITFHNSHLDSMQPQTLFSNFANSIKFLSDVYFENVKHELASTWFKPFFTLLLTADQSNLRAVAKTIYEEAAKFKSFLSFEFKDNISNEAIFAKVSNFFLKQFHQNLNEYREITLKDVEQLSTPVAFNVICGLSMLYHESLQILLTSKYNHTLDLTLIDQCTEYFEEISKKLIRSLFNKLFQEQFKLLNQIYENNSKIGAKPAVKTTVLDLVSSHLGYYTSQNIFKLSETNPFYEAEWENLVELTINCYCMITSTLKRSLNEKYTEIFNAEMDFWNNLLEKIIKKNSRLAMLLLNAQKLYMLDAANMARVIETSSNSFFSSVKKYVVVFHFMKSLEADLNCTYVQAMKLEKEKTFSDIFCNFINLKGKIEFNEIISVISRPETHTSYVQKYLENVSRTMMMPSLENQNLILLEKLIES